MPETTNELDAVTALRDYQTQQAAANAADQRANTAIQALQSTLTALGLPATAANTLTSIINEIDTAPMGQHLTNEQAAQLLTTAANHYRARWIP